MLVIVHYTLAFTKQQKRKEKSQLATIGTKTYRNKMPIFN